MSVREGADDMGQKRVSLTSALTFGSIVKCILRTENNLSIFGQHYKVKQIRLHDENIPQQVIDQIKKPKVQGNSVLSTNSRGEVKEFTSINSTSKAYHIERTYLDKNKSWLYENESYTFTKVNPLEPKKSNISKRDMSILVEGKKRDSKMVFKSLTAAGNFFEIDPKNIEMVLETRANLVINGEFFSFRKR